MQPQKFLNLDDRNFETNEVQHEPAYDQNKNRSKYVLFNIRLGFSNFDLNLNIQYSTF